MGKKKIAVLDLSQSDAPKLKATGVRSQKLTFDKKKDQEVEVAIPVKEPVKTETAAKTKLKTQKKAEKKTKKRVKHPRSKRYLEAKNLIDKTQKYSASQAIKLIKKLSTVKFDPSVELHLNLTVDKLSGELNLPHGTGKTKTVEIASDSTIAKLNDNKIDFDILIAEPKMMPKLAKYAKMLGPKGLMPNPKTGTITDDPKAAKKKLEAGALRYKSENKAPIIHLVIGKLSFKENQLEENITKTINTILPKNIQSAYLCASMSPSVRLKIK